MPTSPFLAPERDEAAKGGRPKRAGVTYYSVPGCDLTPGYTGVPAAGEDWYMPIYVASPIVVDQLLCQNSTTGAGNARIGLYRANTDWQPIGAPLADSGNLDVSTAALKTYTPTTPLYLARGRYLTVLNTSISVTFDGNLGCPPDAYAVSTASNAQQAVRWRVTRAYAAFPTPGTPWDTVTQTGASITQMVVLRVLTP